MLEKNDQDSLTKTETRAANQQNRVHIKKQIDGVSNINDNAIKFLIVELKILKLHRSYFS